MSHAIAPILGVNFDNTITDGNYPFPLGTELLGNDGITYKLVRFTAARTRGLVYIIGSDFTLGNAITTSNSSASPVLLGVPQVDLLAPDAGVTHAYGWVAIDGPLSVAGVAGATADQEIFTTSVGGLVNSLVAGAKRIEGLKFTSTVPTNSAVTAAFAAQKLMIGTDA